jgi:hypothetical protein
VTRREERAERSRQRAAEYQRRKRKRNTIFLIALGLFAGVPLIWYGCVEFGLVRPLWNQDFKESLKLAEIVLLFLMLRFFPEYPSERKKNPKAPTT